MNRKKKKYDTYRDYHVNHRSHTYQSIDQHYITNKKIILTENKTENFKK